MYLHLCGNDKKRVNAIIAIKVESNIMNQSVYRLQQFEIGYLWN